MTASLAVVPFVRSFGPGAVGSDVRAVKRALIRAGFGAGVDGTTDVYGQPAQTGLSRFKARWGLLADPIYTAQAHGHLAPWFDPFGVELLHQEQELLASQGARAAFLDTIAWTIQHHAIFDYTMTEPYRSSMLRLTPRQTAQRVGADCSMHFIGCGNWAGLTHPLFHHDGFTGTILDELRPYITPEQAQPGDAVIFVGPPPYEEGAHITILYEKLANGDWRTGNMGTQGQPAWSTLSGEAEVHRSFAPTLVYVPLPA